MATKKSAAPKKRGYCGIPNNDICGKYHAHAQPAAPQSSPLPWRESDAGPKRLVDKNGFTVFYPASLSKHENTPLVIRRVNRGPAFDAMIEALEKISDGAYSLERDEMEMIACAALKLAQEVK